MSTQRLTTGVLVAVGLVPAGRLVLAAYTGDLGANPIEAVTHVTGDWTLRFLLLALAVTPLRRLLGWNGLIAYRRMLGLFAFFYACLHLSTYVVLDHFFDWPAIVEDVAERPYVTAGATAFLCLLPLAVTSTRGWVRRLGRRWAQLHRLAYVAAIAGVVHYWWLVKADVRAPLWYAGVLATLFALRLAFRWFGARPAGRGDRAQRLSPLRSRRYISYARPMEGAPMSERAKLFTCGGSQEPQPVELEPDFD